MPILLFGKEPTLREGSTFLAGLIKFGLVVSLVPVVYGLSGLNGELLPTTTEGLMLYSEDEVPLGGGTGGGDEVFITTKMPEPQSALLFSVAIAAGAWRARRRRP